MAPIIAVALLSQYKSSVPVAIYLLGACVVTMVAVFFLKETRGISLHDVDAADAQGTADLLAAQEVEVRVATNQRQQPGPALRDPGCCRLSPRRCSARQGVLAFRDLGPDRLEHGLDGGRAQRSGRATAQMGSCRWKTSGRTGRKSGLSATRKLGSRPMPRPAAQPLAGRRYWWPGRWSAGRAAGRTGAPAPRPGVPIQRRRQSRGPGRRRAAGQAVWSGIVRLA